MTDITCVIDRKDGPLSDYSYGYSSDPGNLIGRCFWSYSVSSDKSQIHLFEPDGSAIILSAVGDCCSQSWFEDMDGLENLVDAQILEAQDVNFPERDISDDNGLLQFYALKLKTTKGYVDLNYRNSSNGYYGGSVEITRKEANQ